MFIDMMLQYRRYKLSTALKSTDSYTAAVLASTLHRVQFARWYLPCVVLYWSTVHSSTRYQGQITPLPRCNAKRYMPIPVGNL